RRRSRREQPDFSQVAVGPERPRERRLDGAHKRAEAPALPAPGAGMSTELVRVRIDEFEVHVPKGTGLVETALAAGVEIPGFSYEPRLGEPIGACRMCLVEVEGMPKLQAG